MKNTALYLKVQAGILGCASLLGTANSLAEDFYIPRGSPLGTPIRGYFGGTQIGTQPYPSTGHIGTYGLGSGMTSGMTPYSGRRTTPIGSPPIQSGWPPRAQ